MAGFVHRGRGRAHKRLGKGACRRLGIPPMYRRKPSYPVTLATRWRVDLSSVEKLAKRMFRVAAAELEPSRGLEILHLNHASGKLPQKKKRE